MHNTVYFAVFENNRTTTDTLRFNFSSGILDSSVTRADFYVYIRHFRPVVEESSLMLIFQLLPPKRDKRSKMRVDQAPRLIEKQKFSLGTGTGQWYHFDITRLVHKWIKRPDKNLGLKVECDDDSQGNPLAIIAPRNEQEELYVRSNSIELKSKVQHQLIVI